MTLERRRNWSCASGIKLQVIPTVVTLDIHISVSSKPQYVCLQRARENVEAQPWAESTGGGESSQHLGKNKDYTGEGFRAGPGSSLHSIKANMSHVAFFTPPERLPASKEEDVGLANRWQSLYLHSLETVKSNFPKEVTFQETPEEVIRRR